ncbi:MAG TPA: MgtC/SapB family protein, partial [Streptosporangiaceae bacterium]|nr:MgtC/SapB family protein [Streptosporangiaceae bacterium]
VLSAAIGMEREIRQKNAGLRTHTLVGVGAALFMLISKYGFTDVLEPRKSHSSSDGSRPRTAAQKPRIGLRSSARYVAAVIPGKPASPNDLLVDRKATSKSFSTVPFQSQTKCSRLCSAIRAG